MIGLLNGARLETLCALEMFGHVWQFCVFSPPGSEVTTMHNPATWWRRGKRWIKKERDGNKGQFDYSFPFDGLMGARYTNGCLCIPVISCESSACVFPAYRCSLAAHIHWIQPISGRLINEQPPSLLASIRVFSPLCPQPFYRCVLLLLFCVRQNRPPYVGERLCTHGEIKLCTHLHGDRGRKAVSICHTCFFPLLLFVDLLFVTWESESWRPYLQLCFAHPSLSSCEQWSNVRCHLTFKRGL